MFLQLFSFLTSTTSAPSWKMMSFILWINLQSKREIKNGFGCPKISPWTKCTISLKKKLISFKQKSQIPFLQNHFWIKTRVLRSFQHLSPISVKTWSCFTVIYNKDTIIKLLAPQFSSLVLKCWPGPPKPVEAFIPQPLCTEINLIPNRSCWHWNHSCRFSPSTQPLLF